MTAAEIRATSVQGLLGDRDPSVDLRLLFPSQRVQSTYIVECRDSILRITMMVWRSVPHNGTWDHLGLFATSTIASLYSLWLYRL